MPDHRGWRRPPTDCVSEAGETPAAREGKADEVTPVAAPPNTAPPLPETDESAATGTAAPPSERNGAAATAPAATTSDGDVAAPPPAAPPPAAPPLVPGHREGGQLPAARASETAEGASAAAGAGEAATSGGDAAATPLAAPPRGPDQGGYNGGFCFPSCGRVEKTTKKKKKEKEKKKKAHAYPEAAAERGAAETEMAGFTADRARAAECGAAETKAAHAEPPLDFERIHHLLGTLYNVTKSANLHEIRIEEHDDYGDFEEAAFELSRCLLDEEVLPTVWARLGLAKCGAGMEQALHILWEFGITASQYVLNAIVHTCSSGSPTGHKDV